MRIIMSLVSRCRSRRSPNSGEMISFHSRGSALSCHPRSFDGISTPVVDAENPVFWDWREALSPRDVFAMRAPVPGDAITGISHPDRTVLKMRRPRPYRLLAPSRPRTLRIFHHARKATDKAGVDRALSGSGASAGRSRNSGLSSSFFRGTVHQFRERRLSVARHICSNTFQEPRVAQFSRAAAACLVSSSYRAAC